MPLENEMKSNGFPTQMVQKITFLEEFVRKHQSIQHGGSSIPIIAKNSSGGAVVSGDVGYLDYSSTLGWVFNTTTTAIQGNIEWCVVVSGGANGSDISVTRTGQVSVSYTGTAPLVGQFLVTSAVAGRAQVQTTMRPEIFAVCIANGSGGLVSVQLLCNRTLKPLTSSVDVFRCDNCSDWNWTGTINGAPAGSTITVATTGGTNLNSIVPTNAGHLGKVVMHNTTRGNAMLIDSVAGLVVTMTAAILSGWANGDVVTCRSQTNTSNPSGGDFYYDIDLSSADNTLIPVLAVGIGVWISANDAGAGRVDVHPFETNSNPKGVNFIANAGDRYVTPIPLINRKFCVAGDASGAGTLIVIGRLEEILVASP